MYLGRTYEDVLDAAARLGPRFHRKGMYTPQILRTAAALGVPLRRKRVFDTEVDQGIVVVVYDVAQEADHVVVLREGLLFDTDLSVWDPSTYKATKKARLTELLWRELDNA
jgi:hypothetical protein